MRGLPGVERAQVPPTWRCSGLSSGRRAGAPAALDRIIAGKRGDTGQSRSGPYRRGPAVSRGLEGGALVAWGGRAAQPQGAVGDLCTREQSVGRANSAAKRREPEQAVRVAAAGEVESQQGAFVS